MFDGTACNRVLTSVNVTRLGAARSDDLLVVSASANTQSEATAAINLDSRTHKLRWLRRLGLYLIIPTNFGVRYSSSSSNRRVDLAGEGG